MGYYTQFDITIRRKVGNSNILELVNDATIEMEMATKLCEISSAFNIDDIDNGCESPFYDLISSTMKKWYNHHEDMVKFAKCFPNYYFELSGHGEESEDMWLEYYHGDYYQYAPAIIHYDEPRWN